VRGGESANSVPAHAEATVDIRSSLPEDVELAARELAAGGPYAGVSIAIADRGTWPPLLRAPALAERALEIGAELGLALGEEHSGGVSDGCWTSAMGIATLDGLGPRGGLDHTPDEWIDVAELEPRVELAARLVCAVGR
jgi:glutamate carboxypeptidase